MTKAAPRRPLWTPSRGGGEKPAAPRKPCPALKTRSYILQVIFPSFLLHPVGFYFEVKRMELVASSCVPQPSALRRETAPLPRHRFCGLNSTLREWGEGLKTAATNKYIKQFKRLFSAHVQAIKCCEAAAAVAAAAVAAAAQLSPQTPFSRSRSSPRRIHPGRRL